MSVKPRPVPTVQCLRPQVAWGFGLWGSGALGSELWALGSELWASGALGSVGIIGLLIEWAMMMGGPPGTAMQLSS